MKREQGKSSHFLILSYFSEYTLPNGGSLLDFVSHRELESSHLLGELRLQLCGKECVSTSDHFQLMLKRARTVKLK